MTINELIEQLNQLGAGGDMELRVSAFGGMRSGKSIKSVSLGFDWDRGAVILHPLEPLTLKELPRKARKG